MGAAALGMGVAPAAASAADPLDSVRLPPLRDDLHLLPAPPGMDGSPCWTIHDPVRNRYFRIGHAAFEAIARWHLSAPRAIAAAVAPLSVLGAPHDLTSLALVLGAGPVLAWTGWAVFRPARPADS